MLSIKNSYLNLVITCTLQEESQHEGIRTIDIANWLYWNQVIIYPCIITGSKGNFSCMNKKRNLIVESKFSKYEKTYEEELYAHKNLPYHFYECEFIKYIIYCLNSDNIVS